MAKYRVNFTEKIYYSVLVEADSLEDAEDKAIEAFDSGDESVECTDQFVDYFETYEEETE